MGCIVNGPGEMADADFGYVGGAPGKIDLYVGKVTVQYVHTESYRLDNFGFVDIDPSILISESCENCIIVWRCHENI
jgi:hypothetical protein